jgi:hypothetical protein
VTDYGAKPMRWIVACLLVAAGCRSTTFSDCEVRCTAASGCPEGFSCGTEGRCRPPEATGSCRDVLDDAAGVTREIVLETRATSNRNLDLLFVIDDSPSMVAKQELMKAALPALLAELSALDGSLPSLHVGVISTDVGTKGSASPTPAAAIGQVGNGGCSGLGDGGRLQVTGVTLPDKYVIDLEGTPRTANYAGTLETVIRQMMTLGAGGCGFEQPLHALRLALTNTVENAGFVRSTASLAVIIVSDEDDCSVLDPALFGPESGTLGSLQSFRCFRFGVECAPDDPTVVGAKTGCKARVASPLIEDLAPFRSFLAGVKPDPRDMMIALIGGPPAPISVELRAPAGGTPEPAVKRTCEFTTPTGLEGVDPPIRFAELLGSFAGRSRIERLCSTDITPQVRAVGKTARGLIGDPCLVKPVVDRSAEPGLQPDCVVEDAEGSTFRPVKACSASVTTDCFELVADAALCTEHDHLKLVVRRSSPSPAGVWSVVRCSLAQ